MTTSVPRRLFLKTVGTIGASAMIARRAGAQQAHSASGPMTPPGDTAPPRAKSPDEAMSGMGAAVPLPRGAPPEGSPLYKRYKLELRVVQHEILPGVVVHMLGYAGSVPGPTIRVNEGDWVWVDFINSNDEMHTIHWHGITVDDYRMDGVPYLTQDPVMRGESYRYVFRAKPYGTHFYHCHFGTSLHMQAGMYGAFIVERADDPVHALYPYTHDYTLILSSVDTVFLREQLNSMFARMRQRDALASRGGLDLRTQSRYLSLAELRRDVAAGGVPPYLLSRAAPRPPAPNFFTINGKAYPATEAIRVKEGEWTRLRFINAGNVPFSMHLHGHDFYHVCTDGAPLPAPVCQRRPEIVGI